MAGLVALALSYVLSQFYRSFLAVLTPTLAVDLGMTNDQFSLASGVWFIAFALMQLVVGPSLDRFGPRMTASVLFIFGGAGGAALFAGAWSPEVVIVAMALIGIGCAPLLMASLFIFARTYSPLRFAALTSGFVAIGTGGNVLGAAPLAAVADILGWRATMGTLSVFSLFIAVAILLLVRDPKKIAGVMGGGGFRGYLELLRMRVLWPIIPLTMVAYAPAATIRGLWAGPYLTDSFAAGALTIGNVTFFMALAMVAGSFVYGPLDTLLRTRKWIAFGGNVLNLAALTGLVLMPAPQFFTASILLVAIGFFGMTYGVLMAHASAFLPPHLTGRGVTLMNFFSMGGVGLVQFATGPIFDRASDAGTQVAGYHAIFVFYAVLLAIGLLLYLPARDAPPAAGA